jgi:hypothetical protein
MERKIVLFRPGISNRRLLVYWVRFHGHPPNVSMTSRKRNSPSHIITTLRGEALWRALGFASERSFQRAKASGQIPVPLYPIFGQSRGVYALRSDVERHLERIGKDSGEEGADMS